ncbi:sigma-70 family RNA polymerase sigma factor [Paenibacillus sp. LMG 31456]|uniref:Sigma-70 family RNA polymerase sigma factor n=1 Tax=Paenibacillus foliorum TaxID=2654974 RepID=A0A972K1F8_9BACL|nr:sigma-70 family RNA polymerase sigma factor [Paenibacillus foliorum]NOU92737.1 sigma-70 family RNA polymerase sigma factor [Paenibacillus foliorum]
MKELEYDIKLARKGDKEAFIRLIHAMELNLYRVARSIVKREEDCSDAIQETILKAYHAIHTLREPSFFKTWLFRILINECNQILRKENRLLPSSEAVLSEASTQDTYENIDLKEAVNRLEETLKLVVTLHYFEDIPLKQISQLLETPEGTIKSRLHRARTILAEYLQGPDERRISYESC